MLLSFAGFHHTYKSQFLDAHPMSAFLLFPFQFLRFSQKALSLLRIILLQLMPRVLAVLRRLYPRYQYFRFHRLSD